jgi:UDP-glucose:(heptosyl)LPS alpha-1,3-glucosyltransferase
MKIGLVIEQFDPQRGGAEQWTCQFAERLLARGHEVHVVAKRFSPGVEGLPIVAHELGRTGSRLDFGAAAEAALRRMDLDIVHDMGSGWHCDVLQSHDGSRLAQWRQKTASLPRWIRPIKRGMIGILPRYRAFRALMERQFSDPRRIILAISKMCAADYERFHQVPPDRIRLVYNGVDVRRFSPEHRARYRVAIRLELKVQEQDLLLLFVGRDFRRKGLATAMRAMGRLVAAGNPARLAVVGGGQPQNYLKLARRCGACGAVDFLGAKSDLVPYYAAADALVLPTCYDPCSLSVLEAAASGLPSVTTRFNGAGELLTEGIDGFILSDPADDAQLADRIRQLLDPALRRRMSEAARQMTQKHTLDDNCERIIGVYEEIIHKKQRPCLAADGTSAQKAAAVPAAAKRNSVSSLGQYANQSP